jgi:dihydrofolate reductase
LIADAEIHQHYNELLQGAGAALYGRITYQLMEFWRSIVENPTGQKAFDEFAVTMDNIPKIVFSHTLKNVDWKTARLATKNIEDEVSELRESGNGGSKYILISSRSLIVTLLNLHLIDEFQLCVQPIIAGKGLPLFENINDRIDLKLLKTKTFASSGSIVMYYEPTKK